MIPAKRKYRMRGTLCPACKLRCCVSRVNMDYAECPDHGIIPGLVLLECRGMAPWKALIEILAAQAQAEIHRMADHYRGEIWGVAIQRLARYSA